MAQRHAFLALTNPAPGREDEFNDWYDTHHLPEVLRYGSGMRGGRRFRLSPAQRPGHAPPWRYLAWYDLEHDDLAAFHHEPWAPASPPLKPFAGLIADGFAGWLFTPMAEGVNGFDSCPRGDDYLFLALTNAGAGQEAAFNAWYDQSHLPEIVAGLPGFHGGRRYEASPHQRQNQPQPEWRYMAAYSVAAENGGAVHAAAGGVTGLTRAGPGVLAPGHVAWLFEPVGPYVERSGI